MPDRYISYDSDPSAQQVNLRQREDNNNDYDSEYFQQSQPLVAERQNDYYLDPEHLKSIENTTTKSAEHGLATASGTVALILILLIIIVFGCVYCCLDPSVSSSCINFFAMIREKIRARSNHYRSEYSDKRSLLRNDELDLQANPRAQRPQFKTKRRRKSKQKCQRIEISGLPCRSQDEISIAITSCDENCKSGELQFGDSSASPEVSSDSSSDGESRPAAPAEYKREYIYSRKPLGPQDQRKQSHNDNSEDSSIWRNKRYNDQQWENSDSNRSKYGAVVEGSKGEKYLIIPQHVKSQHYDKMIANWKQTYPTLQELKDNKKHNGSYNQYLENLGPPPPPPLEEDLGPPPSPRKPRHRQSR